MSYKVQQVMLAWRRVFQRNFSSETSARKMVPWKQMAGTKEIAMLALGPFITSHPLPAFCVLALAPSEARAVREVYLHFLQGAPRIRSEWFRSRTLAITHPRPTPTTRPVAAAPLNLSTVASPPDSARGELNPVSVAPPPTFHVGLSLRDMK